MNIRWYSIKILFACEKHLSYYRDFLPRFKAYCSHQAL